MKAKVRKAGRRRKYASITRLVKEALGEDEGMGLEALVSRVKKFFPGSKIDNRHASWYRVAYRKGILKGVK